VVFQVEALEVDGFESAVAGLEVEYVRTNAGYGPCRTTCAGSGDTMTSVGLMGFSAIARTAIPNDRAVFLLVSEAPPRAAYCGVELEVGKLHFYGPGMPFIGTDPAGLAVTLLVTSTASIRCAADLLETGDPAMGWSTSALPDGPAVERLSSFLAQLSLSPETMDDVGATELAAELAANALTANTAHRREPAGTRLNSRQIVRDAIDYAESTRTFQPTMSQLCRAACASESRVRQAFVEVLDAPPTQYFRYRLLSRLRADLLSADPTNDSVTHIASSLGVTQLGRVAGRYRGLYDELPSDTLRQRPKRGRARSTGDVRPHTS
jgi:AraC family ethanolamine operon transcriptional activator